MATRYRKRKEDKFSQRDNGWTQYYRPSTKMYYWVEDKPKKRRSK